MEFTPKHIEALKRIVDDWIDEGFTTPPYEPEYYDIFNWLNMQSYDIEHRKYDISRPPSQNSRS